MAFGVNTGVSTALAERHAAMLAAYRARDWDRADAAISDCRAIGIDGLGTCYQVYRRRIDEWRKTPPPDDWDGTYTATEK